MNSRGISPLIATVLLMAFAVALGGMIMNWSTKMDDKIVLGCGKITVETNRFCRTEKSVAMDLKNVGEMDIAQVTLKLKNGEDVYEVKVPDSTIGQQETIRKQVPAVAEETTDVELYASVIQNYEPRQCPKPLLEQQKLPAC